MSSQIPYGAHNTDVKKINSNDPKQEGWSYHKPAEPITTCFITYLWNPQNINNIYAFFKKCY